MQLKFKAVTILFLFMHIFSYSQSNKSTTNYLNISGPISFLNKSYNLTWASHPTSEYYKQEYIPSGDNVDKFNRMILVEVLVGDSKPSDLVSAKIAELKKIKETNPIVNYEMFQKNGEYILDFLLTDNKPNGDINIIERNVYRYKSGKDKTGKAYVLLFGVSDRAYGNKSQEFLSNLKKNKTELVNAVAAFAIPAISLK